MARQSEHLTLEGLAELRDTFKKVAPVEAEKAASDTVGEIAEVVEHRLFRRLQGKSRTGRLAQSLLIRKRAPKDGIITAEVRGGGTAPYLIIRELGTVHTAPAPAIVPTVEETRPELPAMYRSIFVEQLAKRLKR